MKEIVTKDSHWFASHVRSSQYLLQIVKCKNLLCCLPKRSKLSSIIENFLPAPFPLSQIDDNILIDTKNGKFPDLGLTKILDLKQIIGNTAVPKGGNLFNIHDLFCPSMVKEISKRTCTKCYLYFASATLLIQHLKSHKITVEKLKPTKVNARRNNEVLVTINQDVLWLNEEDVNIDNLEFEATVEEDEFPVITISDIFDNFKNNDC